MAKKSAIEEVERYEYLLVEYVKQVSNESTYLVAVVTTLFLYMLTNLFSDKLISGKATQIMGLTSVGLLKIVLVIIMLGGFTLFALSNYRKRKIEKRFEEVIEKK